MEPLFIILAVVAAFALLLGRIADRRGQGGQGGQRIPARSSTVLHKKRDEPSPDRSRTGSRPDPLVTACGGDHAKADRLAAFELRKAPGISQDEARRRALDRLSRDRGR